VLVNAACMIFGEAHAARRIVGLAGRVVLVTIAELFVMKTAPIAVILPIAGHATLGFVRRAV
jgi:hypothetical protein